MCYVQTRYVVSESSGFIEWNPWRGYDLRDMLVSAELPFNDVAKVTINQFGYSDRSAVPMPP